MFGEVHVVFSFFVPGLVFALTEITLSVEERLRMLSASMVEILPVVPGESPFATRGTKKVPSTLEG